MTIPPGRILPIVVIDAALDADLPDCSASPSR